MTGRVKEHPKSRARLVLLLGRTKSENRCLRGVQVIDRDIEMHLLRSVLARPLWRREPRDPLEPQRIAVLGPNEPGDLVVLVKLPVEQRAVERRQDLRVGAVEDNDRETCDSHGQNTKSAARQPGFDRLGRIARDADTHSGHVDLVGRQGRCPVGPVWGRG